MEYLEKIKKAFEGEEEVMIIVSKLFKRKLEIECANYVPKENPSKKYLSQKPIDNFYSIMYDGLIIHFCSDYEKIINKN